MSKCIIMGAKSYKFENDKQEKIEGARISYILADKSNKNNEFGYLPMQSTVSLEILETVKVFPGLYELQYGMIPGRNNKPQLEVTGFKFIKDVNLNTLFN